MLILLENVQVYYDTWNTRSETPRIYEYERDSKGLVRNSNNLQQRNGLDVDWEKRDGRERTYQGLEERVGKGRTGVGEERLHGENGPV
jgi:hypothetical protein